MILSLVRNQVSGAIGFLGIKNRANVLLSRAMHGMYIIGNAQSLRACRKSNIWGTVLEILSGREYVGNELKVGATVIVPNFLLES